MTILALLFISLTGKGQESIADSCESQEFPFVNYEADTLINARHLIPFFNKLLKLENGDTSQVSIVHIGDSHIQADFLTREVRKNLQLRFGNAGRGLVFPLRVGGTNEPTDYRSSTNVAWSGARIVSQSRFPEPGVSGISLYTDRSGAYLELTTSNHDELDYAFDQVTLIHAKDSLKFDCRITDSPLKFGYLMTARELGQGDCSTWVRFLHPTNYVRIQAEQTEPGQQSLIVNGVILQNSLPGVLYNSIGINGAHFNDYNNSPLFFIQLKVLKPDLVIISLGTNEGANLKVSEDETVTAIVSMVRNIKTVTPETCILIVTPTDDYFRKKYKNPYLEAVERALLKSADQENVGCCDLYSITGGYGSCVEWRKAAMLQRDGVHFNKQGYVLQGSLLYNALIDSYLKYAAD